MKLRHAPWGHPRQMGHGGRVWQNEVHWRREWQTTSVFLPWELQEQLELQFSSVTQSCPTHCNPIDCSTPGFPVHHQIPESTHNHVHWVNDAIQPSHHLSSVSPPALNLSQHQGLFKWVSSLHHVAKVLGVSASTSVLPMNTQDWSPLWWNAWISLQSWSLSRVFSNTTVQRHQFFSTQLSLKSNSHIHTWLLEKPKPWLDGLLLAKWCLFLICCLYWS